MNDMNWITTSLPVFIAIILIIIGYYWSDHANSKPRRCSTCRKKKVGGWMEITCKNKRSEKYGHWVDEFDCCSRWKG